MEPSAFRYWLKPWLTETCPGVRVYYKKKFLRTTAARNFSMFCLR
jgi:hypothetical protein